MLSRRAMSMPRPSQGWHADCTARNGPLAQAAAVDTGGSSRGTTSRRRWRTWSSARLSIADPDRDRGLIGALLEYRRSLGIGCASDAACALLVSSAPQRAGRALTARFASVARSAQISRSLPAPQIPRRRRSRRRPRCVRAPSDVRGAVRAVVGSSQGTPTAPPRHATKRIAT